MVYCHIGATIPQDAVKILQSEKKYIIFASIKLKNNDYEKIDIDNALRALHIGIGSSRQERDTVQ